MPWVTPGSTVILLEVTIGADWWFTKFGQESNVVYKSIVDADKQSRYRFRDESQSTRFVTVTKHSRVLEESELWVVVRPVICVPSKPGTCAAGTEVRSSK